MSTANYPRPPRHNFPVQTAEPPNTTTVVPIPRARDGVIVKIDGEPYCSFVDANTAQHAITLWEERWPAVAGKKLEVAA